MIHTPGVFAYLQCGYSTSRGKAREKLVNVLTEGFSLKPDIARGLLSGKIKHTVEGDTVVFEVEDGVEVCDVCGS
jgi:hypothetical protein